MKEKKADLSTTLLGAHMSIAGGLHLAIERGDSIGCTAIQIFVKSSRQWGTGTLPTPEAAELFKTTLQKASHVKMVIAHAGYLINLASPNKDTWRKSTYMLAQEVVICQTLGIPYLVVHPGARLESDEKAAFAQVASSLDIILAKHPGDTVILIETMAGQGSIICHQFEHIAQIRDQVKQKHRIGVCIDTCHLFAAGYIFDAKDSYEKMWRTFDDIVGLQYLKAMHLNDSQTTAGSHVDRHEDIGKGKMGIDPFKFIMNDSRFVSIPKILETPKETLADDARNLNTLKGLIG